MKQRWVIGLAVLAVVSVQAHADVLLKGGAQVTGATVVEMTQAIRAGASEATVVGKLGSELGASLFSIVTSMKGKNAFVGGDDEAAFKAFSAAAVKADANTMVSQLAKMAEEGQSFTAKNVAARFGVSVAPSAPAPRAEATTKLTALQLLQNYVPQSEETKAILKGLLADDSKSGKQDQAKVARFIHRGQYVAPKQCGTQAAQCALNWPEVVLHAHAEGNLNEFLEQGMTNFASETPNYVGSAKPVMGFKSYYKTPKPQRSKPLTTCVETGQAA